jgi:putative ABC transport system permease protein
MMSPSGNGNRAMFWRIVRRLLGANRGRLFVILLALGAGAAVTAALLNLQVDAKRRITSEFRAFGANTLITPRNAEPGSEEGATLDQSLASLVPRDSEAGKVAVTSFLYVIADASANPESNPESKTSRVVVAGIGGSPLITVMPFQQAAHAISLHVPRAGVMGCAVGKNAAAQLHAQLLLGLRLRVRGHEGQCAVGDILEFGGPEDNQVFWSLEVVQGLSELPHRLSTILLRVPGTPSQIDRYIADLQKQFPEADVRPIRQFTAGEAKVYGRISGLLTATVVIVLLLTGLCVMAAMTNVAMERKNDVGLMKAIGGATRRVLRLFMMEAALLGFAGGAIGAAAGIFLSIWLGKQVFGVAAQPRLIVYPVAVALTTIVAILSAYPLRRLASVRPASVFRGEA